MHAVEIVCIVWHYVSCC